MLNIRNVNGQVNGRGEILEGETETPVAPEGPSLVSPQVVVHDEPLRDDIQKRREIEHFSFCDGLFPIHTVRTPSGSMGRCEINGRTFSFSSVDDSLPDQKACTVQIWDGGTQVVLMTVYRGRSMAEPVAIGALKEYVKRLSGSNKFHGRGGFLKQAVERLRGAQMKGGRL